MTTPRLGLESWAAGITQPNVPVNNNSQRLDALLGGSVKSRTVTAQPGSPADGDAYILPAGKTGAQWAGFSDNHIAYFNAGTWYAYAPHHGLRLYCDDESVNVQYVTSAWEVLSSSGMVNPMTTAGDLIRGGASGAPTRVAVGAEGQVLKVVSGVPAWATQAAGGDVSGPVSSTDNTLPRFDGTGGKTLQTSGVVVEDDNAIHGYRASLNQQTGTTYTLVTGDRGKVIELTNASAITLTLPNSLAVGWCATIVQGGAGQVTLSVAGGGTLRNRQSHTKIAGQWGAVTLYVRTNAGGSAAEYVLAGDTAA